MKDEYESLHYTLIYSHTKRRLYWSRMAPCLHLRRQTPLLPNKQRQTKRWHTFIAWHAIVCHSIVPHSTASYGTTYWHTTVRQATPGPATTKYAIAHHSTTPPCHCMVRQAMPGSARTCHAMALHSMEHGTASHAMSYEATLCHSKQCHYIVCQSTIGPATTRHDIACHGMALHGTASHAMSYETTLTQCLAHIDDLQVLSNISWWRIWLEESWEMILISDGCWI